MNKKYIFFIALLLYFLKRIFKNSSMSEKLITPLEKYKFVSGYGIRWGNQFHNGVDLAISGGTPIRAVCDAKVTNKGFNNLSGNFILIQSLNFPELVFGHAHLLKETSLKIGDKIKQGETIGFVGSTGKSDGNHLHFTVRKNGKIENPENFIKFK